jgi:hypothetical protein
LLLEENYLKLLLIICRVTVDWENAKACFFRIKKCKWHQNGTKICSGNLHFSDQTLWITCSYSQSLDTIPLWNKSLKIKKKNFS